MKGERDCIEEGGIEDEGGEGLYQGGGVADEGGEGLYRGGGYSR